jgi:hypothetical protein
MSAAQIALPKVKVLSAALRKTTEHLAAELARPTESTPEWNELEWRVAHAVAALQGISALLASRLRWRGPADWQSFLTEQRAQSILRHAKIGALLERIDAAASRSAIPCVALKGAALRALGIYAPGERPMGDVDLLVRPQDLASVERALRALDYVEAHRMARHTTYHPRRAGPAIVGFGEHVDNPLAIEVHVIVAEPLPVRTVEITADLWPVQPRPGINPYSGNTALVMHLLLHAAGNMRAHALRQIQLHDIAMLPEPDWDALLGTKRDRRCCWWAYPPLALTERYYPGTVPGRVLRPLREACPRALRFAAQRESLSGVSWSNLRIHAFPGITWSRTPLDALRYVRSRTVPSRAQIATLHHALRAQPHLNRVPWYGMTHGARIVRWLFSRPPRVQTISSIMAVFDGGSLRAVDRSAPTTAQ